MNTAIAPARDSRPWYREPYVWMILGGPLAVVVASFITFGLAASHQDPVLEHKDPSVEVDRAALDKMTPEQRANYLESAQPALTARNHVATPPRRPAEP